MVIISEKIYNKIIEFITNFNYLAIECENEIKKQFPDIPLLTLKGIISKYGQNSTKSFYYKNHRSAHLILRE